ncbi:hypothetical protein ABT122_29325, partial [Streptomyces sp. NPDC001985]
NDRPSLAHHTAAAQYNVVTVLLRFSRFTWGVARARATAMIGERRALFASTASALRDAVPGLPADTARGLGRYVDLVERFQSATLHWLAITGRFTPDAMPVPGSAPGRAPVPGSAPGRAPAPERAPDPVTAPGPAADRARTSG